MIIFDVGYLRSGFRYFQDRFAQKPGPTLSLLVQIALRELDNMYSSLFPPSLTIPQKKAN